MVPRELIAVAPTETKRRENIVRQSSIRHRVHRFSPVFDDDLHVAIALQLAAPDAPTPLLARLPAWMRSSHVHANYLQVASIFVHTTSASKARLVARFDTTTPARNSCESQPCHNAQIGSSNALGVYADGRLLSAAQLAAERAYNLQE